MRKHDVVVYVEGDVATELEGSGALPLQITREGSPSLNPNFNPKLSSITLNLAKP